MELKPSRDKPQGRQKLDGVGNPVAKGDERNPFAALGRGINPGAGNRRRRPFADTLGATPPRDGPFSMSAKDVAVQKPPKGRKKRKRDAQLPWMR